MTLIERIKNDYVLGLVLHQSTLTMYMAPSAWFVMDYPSYDPSILASKDRPDDFRDGVLLVDTATSEAYLKAMQPDSITVDELKAELPAHKDALQPIFLIDFDNQRYSSWFFDIEYEAYVPEGWVGAFENPVDHLPDAQKSLWS